jgi:hypothetical protein
MTVSARRTLDIYAILAVTWLLVAVGLTVVFAPRLGIRGLGWMAAHHLLCLVGVSHEYTRYRRRQALRASSAAGASAGSVSDGAAGDPGGSPAAAGPDPATSPDAP